jgi:hypothetical protein
VTDLAGNPMGAAIATSVVHLPQLLAREAEAGMLAGGMVALADPAASGGACVWLPDGAYGESWRSVNAADRAEYTFNVPRSGTWMVRGRVRSDDISSHSFWAEFDGHAGAGTLYQWMTEPAATRTYAWDDLNHRNAFGRPDQDPVTVVLAAGSHSLTIYGREDGTRLDRLELVSLRPLVSLTGPDGPAARHFTINVVFSEPVGGLTAGDFMIRGGTITGLMGTGANYLLQVAIGDSPVLVSLPENSVTDSSGAGNHESDLFVATTVTTFDQWAAARGIPGAAPDANEDGDSYSNLLEYAFNTDPAAFGATTYDPAVPAGPNGPAGQPHAEVIGTPDSGCVLRLTFLRRRGLTGIAYTPEFSSDLAAWFAFDGVPEVVRLNAEWEAVTVEASVPGGGTTQCFGRVQVRTDE